MTAATMAANAMTLTAISRINSSVGSASNPPPGRLTDPEAGSGVGVAMAAMTALTMAAWSMVGGGTGVSVGTGVAVGVGVGV